MPPPPRHAGPRPFGLTFGLTFGATLGAPVGAAAVALSSREVATLLGCARMLLLAAREGSTRPWLSGRNLGLVCGADDAGHADATLFRHAATELGARVAQVRPSLSADGSAQELQHTARLLGRLYDALECQGLPAELVQHLRAHVDVPVYDGLATPANPTAGLADLLDASAAPAERRRFVVQAVLLTTLG